MIASPNKMFENSKDGVCSIKTQTRIYGAGVNQNLISAVSGKKIRLIGLITYTTTGLFSIKDGSGGTGLLESTLTAIPFLFLPPTELGYLESSVGTALVTDVTVATVHFFLQYIEYTP